MSAALDDFLALAYAAALGILPGPVAQPPVRQERSETTMNERAPGAAALTERTMLTAQREAPLEWNMPSNVR